MTTTPPRYGSRLAFTVASCLAAGFAFWATSRQPYSFYIVTRWAVFLTCCWGLFRWRRRFWPSVAPAYAIVGLLFNPLFPFYFSRATWHNFDIGAGIILLASLAFSRSPDDSTQNEG